MCACARGRPARANVAGDGDGEDGVQGDAEAPTDGAIALPAEYASAVAAMNGSLSDGGAGPRGATGARRGGKRAHVDRGPAGSGVHAQYAANDQQQMPPQALVTGSMSAYDAFAMSRPQGGAVAEMPVALMWEAQSQLDYEWLTAMAQRRMLMVVVERISQE